MQPGADIGGIGMGLVRMVRPWNEWLIVWGYDINEPPPEVDEAHARPRSRTTWSATTRSPVDDRVDVAVDATTSMYATRYSEGRVFCMGDAVPPPSAVERARLEHLDPGRVQPGLEARARPARARRAPRCCDTYDAERAPIGKQIVMRANKSIEEFGPIFEALGLLDTNDPEQMRRNMAARTDDTPEAAERSDEAARGDRAQELRVQRARRRDGPALRSAAVVSDGTPEPAFDARPGAVLPPDDLAGRAAAACWLEHAAGSRCRTLDLAGKGRFALLTGIGGGHGRPPRARSPTRRGWRSRAS